MDAIYPSLNTKYLLNIGAAAVIVTGIACTPFQPIVGSVLIIAGAVAIIANIAYRIFKAYKENVELTASIAELEKQHNEILKGRLKPLQKLFEEFFEPEFFQSRNKTYKSYGSKQKTIIELVGQSTWENPKTFFDDLVKIAEDSLADDRCSMATDDLSSLEYNICIHNKFFDEVALVTRDEGKEKYKFNVTTPKTISELKKYIDKVKSKIQDNNIIFESLSSNAYDKIRCLNNFNEIKEKIEVIGEKLSEYTQKFNLLQQIKNVKASIDFS